MIDFLKNAGINNDVLVEMIKNNDETAIFDLSCNPKDSVEIIKYMRNIGCLLYTSPSPRDTR